MATPPRPPNRPLYRRLLRALLHILAVFALVLLAGMTVQAYAERTERERFPPPGQLVDIGDGQLIHVRQWGEGNAGPTIVLDISAAMPSSGWAWVGQGLAELGHHVVAYDRPGMAWSRGPWQPRDARHAADALANALETAGITPPFVVVAHSYGGFSSRVFSGVYRDGVAALVLLDTTYADRRRHGGIATFYRLQAWLAHSGLLQLAPPPDSFTTLPPAEGRAAYSVTQWTTHRDTTAEELEAWEVSAEQVLAFPTFGDLPLLVVAATEYGPAHLEFQRQMLELSSASRYVEIDAQHSGMLVSEPQAAQVVHEVHGFIVNLP